MYVHEHEIPKALVQLIEAGVWPTDRSRGEWQELNPLLSTEAAKKLCPLSDRIILEYPPFQTIQDEADGGNEFWYRDLTNVGDISYSDAVIIGDFGLGSDSPIILYYGDSTVPVVMYLRWSGNGDSIVHSWEKTHYTFRDFTVDVGLIPVD